MNMKDFTSKFLLKEGMKMIDKLTDNDMDADKAIGFVSKFAIAIWDINNDNCNEQLDHISEHEMAKRTGRIYVMDRKITVSHKGEFLILDNEDGTTTKYIVKDHLATQAKDEEKWYDK